MSIDDRISESEEKGTICEMKVYVRAHRTVSDFRSVLCFIWNCDKCKDYYKDSKCEHYNPVKNGLPIH